jgi:hypothetical protein
VGHGWIAQQLLPICGVVVINDSTHAVAASRRGQSLEVEEVGREEVGRGAKGDVDRLVFAATGHHYILFNWRNRRLPSPPQINLSVLLSVHMSDLF